LGLNLSNFLNHIKNAFITLESYDNESYLKYELS